MNNHDIYLQVAMSDQKRAAHAAFGLIDRLQNETPGIQVAAIALLYSLMCEVFELHPLRLNEYISKMVWDRANKNYLPTFAAIKQYIEEDVKNGLPPRLTRKS